MSCLSHRKDKTRRDCQTQIIGVFVIGFVVFSILFFLDPEAKKDRNRNNNLSNNNQVWLKKENRMDPLGDTDVLIATEKNINFQNKIRELYAIGVKDSRQLAHMLENEDVFGTKVGPDAFQCPKIPSDRLEFPILTNQLNLQRFRENKEDSFIFYQHLRKAGGTGFCDLANSNLPKGTVPSYYCMPDNRGSLATPPWNNMSYTLQQVHNKHYRIIANEWDVFSAPFISYPDVVLATTIRHPIDRWYSQYRFEHLEHRDGSKPDAPRNPFLTWYNNNVFYTMGSNYYVKTFLGEQEDHIPSRQEIGDFYWTYHKFNRKEKPRIKQNAPLVSWTEFETAVNNLKQFHIILVMEWLSSSPPFIEKSLGWKIPPKQVLPHEVQAKRENKKSKASKDMLSTEDYNTVLSQNVFDLLLFEIAKRIFLERLTCGESAV